jgi:putative DNA primase/helicase
MSSTACRALPRMTGAFIWGCKPKPPRSCGASQAKIEHSQGGGAFYRVGTDTIHLPSRQRFSEAADYYATALHEVGHWTGHPNRLNRDLRHPFGSEGYAREELRAEIASMIMGSELVNGLDCMPETESEPKNASAVRQ